MANSRRTATPEDVAEVEAKRQKCREQFTIESVANSMTKFYNLMITMGFWPLSSIHLPPNPIDTALAQSLGYSAPVIKVIQSLPYPTENVIYDQTLRIFELTRTLDLTDREDLQWSRHPERDLDDPPIDEHLITLMVPSGPEGSIVLLDCDIGAIYHYRMDGPRCDTLEYRVGRRVYNVPEDEDWELYSPGPFKYRFAPFVPAIQWFDGLYQKYLTLRRLPFLDPRYDGDRDMNLAEVGPEGDPLRERIKHKQDVLVELYAKHGWPDFEAWDRDGFLADWEMVKTRLRREDKEQMDSEWEKENQ